MANILLTGGRAGTIHMKAPVGALLHDTKTPGFGVSVGKTGRSYVVRFRVRGLPRQYTRRLGSIDDIRLTDARDLAVSVKATARAGKHPDQDRWDAEAKARAAAREQAEAQTLTFKAVADCYLEDRLAGGGGELASNGELRRKLTVDLAAWHDRSIREIDDVEIDRLVRAKAQLAGPAANRLLSFIKRVFAYARKRRWIAANPALEVEKAFRETPRDRYLTPDEIRVFWAACDRLGHPAGTLFKLCLVLGQRRGEVAGLRRSELGVLEYREAGRKEVQERRAWLLPAERVKRRKSHAVPLPSLALELIAQASADTVEGVDHLLASGADDAPVSGWSKYRRRLDGAIAELMAEEAGEEVDLERHQFERPWHIHDLRATAATHMGMEPLNVPLQVISRVLNHAEGDRGRSMTRRYVRHAWDAEAFAALEAWSDRLRSIVGLNIMPIVERRGA